MEEVIRDLEESLSKRNPNSISNLIRATNQSTSDALLLDKCKRQAEEIEELKDDINSLRSNYDNKIRSLRQEYNKMKIKFESQIESFKNIYGEDASSVKKTAPIIKNIAQAMTRIR